MTRSEGSSRRGLRFIARSGALVSAVMLMVSIVSALHASAALVLPAGGAPTPGQQMQANNSTSGVTNGVQDTPFVLSYDGDNACAGDSAAGGYRVNSFMVPAAVDASQLVYTAAGPTAPAGVAFARSLYNTTNTAQRNVNTAPTTGIITAGNLSQPFSFGALVAGGIAVPNGEYKIGLACTVLGVTDEYWETTIAVTGSTTGPVAFAWEVTEGSTTTTSSTSTSTTSSTSTTTTTIRSTSSSSSTSTSTTTTSTTTTAAPTSTATTIAFVSVTGSLPSVGSQGPTSGGSGTFPVTGASPVPIVIWAILLLVFGRMAILLARPLKVVPARSR